MVPSFEHFDSPSGFVGGHNHAPDPNSAVLERRDIFSLEEDVAGLVLQYEYTYGDKFRRAGWEPLSGENFFEIEALRAAGSYLCGAFCGRCESMEGPFSVYDATGAPPRRRLEDLEPAMPCSSEARVDPVLNGFEVSRKAAYVKQHIASADVVVLYEVKPERPERSPRWAFPDILDDSSLDDFGNHLEFLNPVFVQIACVDGVRSHRFVFSEKAGAELIELATRDLSRMPNEFLFGLKEQLLKLGHSLNLETALNLSHGEIRLRMLESTPEAGELLVEASPLGVFRLKMHYEPGTSKVITSAGKMGGSS